MKSLCIQHFLVPPRHSISIDNTNEANAKLEIDCFRPCFLFSCSLIMSTYVDYVAPAGSVDPEVDVIS